MPPFSLASVQDKRLFTNAPMGARKEKGSEKSRATCSEVAMGFGTIYAPMGAFSRFQKEKKTMRVRKKFIRATHGNF